jgi:hypothetical protein
MPRSHTRTRILPLFLGALFLSACTGGRPVKIVRTDQSSVVGTLVAMRPDVVEIDMASGTRVSEPRAGIASITLPDAAELSALQGTDPQRADRGRTGDTAPSGSSGDSGNPAQTGGPPDRAKDTPREQQPPQNTDGTSDEPRRKDAPRAPERTATNGSSTGTAPTNDRTDGSRPDEGQRPVDHGPVIVVPADTVLVLSLDAALQSDTSRAEERVDATLTAPVILNRTRVVPAGTHVRGDVIEAVPAKEANGRGRLTIRFHTLVLDSEEVPIAAAPLSYVAAVLTRGDAKKVGAGAAAGAVFGGIWSKTKKGLGIGAATGAGATAIALSRNNEMHLDRGTALRVRLTEPVVLRGLP